MSSGGESHIAHAGKKVSPGFKTNKLMAFGANLRHASVTGVYFNRQKTQWIH